MFCVLMLSLVQLEAVKDQVLVEVILDSLEVSISLFISEHALNIRLVFV